MSKTVKIFSKFTSSTFFFCLFFSTYALSSELEDNNTSTKHIYPANETYTEQIILDTLINTNNARWNYDAPLGTAVTINFSFATAESGYLNPILYEHREYKNYEKDAVRKVLQSISESADITFNEVNSTSSNVDMMFTIGIDEDLADAPPSNSTEASEIRYVKLDGESTLAYFNPERDVLPYQKITASNIDYKHDYATAKKTLLHVMGLALGLKHPFSSDGRPLGNFSTEYFTVLEFVTGAGPNKPFKATNLRKMDIIALQHLYGKSKLISNAGDTIYTFDDNYDFHQLLIDSNGNDTISLETAKRKNIIDLRPSAFSSIATNLSRDFDDDRRYLGRHYNNFIMHPDSEVENAIGGSNDDELIGNKLENELAGGKGNDKLRGFGGNDTLDGGQGTDTAVYDGVLANYIIVSEGETTFEVAAKSGSEGVDTLHNIEKVQFSDKTVHNPVIGAEDQDVISGATVTLDAKGTDGDDDNLVIVWLQIGGLEVELQNANTAIATFVAPDVSQEQELTFRVGVSDGLFLPAKTIKVTITPKPNTKPVLEDIADVSVIEKSSVSLTANASDADGDAITYSWAQTDGTSVSLSGADTKTVSFTSPDVATDTRLTFKVTASDGKDSVEKTVIVTVTPKPNTKPVLEDIANESVNENTSVSLTANANDADGDPITYSWTQTGGTNVSLSGTDTKTVSFTAPDVAADTTLTFKVSASDGKDSVEKVVTVTIKNIAPTAGNPDDKDNSDKSSGGGSMGWIFTLPLLALALGRRKRLH
ncbi:GlyGly-CTERM sorting domain-containing protein [Parashewanella curva]|uniref:GlyGly-CTERM sorting domain-containing protein n=1 Tax=Parashewanella curva TaxID=2338552 RepID=A0A3L8PR09_9GAMM|nr:GlyGly-CTERM sorting domain-containing protein [Parashewanella curva]RLV57785.1 GlyGly-CTERM sorting domain-containing protein [Parashewanella curva]